MINVFIAGLLNINIMLMVIALNVFIKELKNLKNGQGQGVINVLLAVPVSRSVLMEQYMMATPTSSSIQTGAPNAQAPIRDPNVL